MIDPAVPLPVPASAPAPASAPTPAMVADATPATRPGDGRPMTAVSCVQCGVDLLTRITFFATLWLIIAGRDPASWVVGAPMVLLAAVASLALRRPRKRGLSLAGLLRFAPFFVIESLRGGLDVTVRVLRPRVRIAPGFQNYRMRLADPRARVFFFSVISLLPGTLSADVDDDRVLVHALDAEADLNPELQRLERRVADLFGEALTSTD